MERIKKWLYSIKADKYLHFIFGMLLAQVAFAVSARFSTTQFAVLLAFCIGTVCCLLKEVWDRWFGVPSVWDFLAGEIGVVIGIIVSLI